MNFQAFLPPLLGGLMIGVASVLLLIGLPFVLNFERQSSLEGVAVGLLLCALFFVADFLFQDLGQRGVLSPAVAGIAPVVLFGGLGLAGQDRLAT